MAALDFPNSPTVGQVATLTNGSTYQWDGTVWIPAGTAPGQAAGGSLAGTYPNPSVAASAIRGTPSAGGTAREISKASIWGGDDLIDASVPWAKMALFSYAHVYRAAALSVPNAINTQVSFDTADANVGGLYSAGTPNIFTIQQAGVYLCGGGLALPASAGGVRREVWIDAGFFAANHNGPLGGQPCSMLVVALIPATVGQVLKLWVFQDSGGALTAPTGGQAAPHFWIVRVG